MNQYCWSIDQYSWAVDQCSRPVDKAELGKRIFSLHVLIVILKSYRREIND